MTTDKNNSSLQLTIYNQQITRVLEFVYLSHKLLSNNNVMVNEQHQIALGWASFKWNQEVLTSSRVYHHFKAKIFDAYTLIVVIYGLDCVNWTTKSFQKLAAFKYHVMRLMTDKHLSDRITIIELFNIRRLKSITSVIKSRVLKLHCHITRSIHGVSKLFLQERLADIRSKS